MFIYNMVTGALVYVGRDELLEEQAAPAMMSLESEAADGDNERDSVQTN